MADATPSTPSTTNTTANDVLIAKKDIILFNEDAVPIELMSDLVFENIGGQELINIARHDTVNGQTVIYQPIKNLTYLDFQYSPQNILKLQETDESYFKQFPISFNHRVPVCGTGYSRTYGPNYAIDKFDYTDIPNCKIVYIDPETGDLIINVINTASDEQVEVQILTSGTINNDTIYGVENT
jgi:hypothetical protein